MNNWYPKFLTNIFNGNVSSSDTFKCILVNGYVYSHLHETYADIISSEISHASYTSGGNTTTLDFASRGFNKFDWNIEEWSSTGFTVSGAVIYKVGVSNETSYLVHYYDFGGSKEITSSTFSLSKTQYVQEEGNLRDFDISSLTFDGTVTCSIPDNDGGIIVGGGFTSVSSSNGLFSRNGLCQINKKGEVTSFNPVVSISGTSSSFYPSCFDFDYENNILYVGLAGSSSVVLRTSETTTTTRRIVFRIFVDTSYTDDWNPVTSSISASINSVSYIPEQKKLLIGGSFSNVTIGGRSGTNYLTMITADPNSSSSTAESNFPDDSGGTLTYPSSIVYSVKWEPSLKKIYVGGAFTNYDGLADHDYVIRFHADPDNPSTYGRHDTTWTPRPNWNVFSVAAARDIVYLGGQFGVIGTENISDVARVNTSNGDPDPNWNAGLVGTAYHVLLKGEYLYCAGSMTNPDNDVFRIKVRESADIVDTTWDTGSSSIYIGNFGTNQLHFLFDKIVVSKGSNTTLFGGQVYSQSNRLALLEI